MGWLRGLTIQALEVVRVLGLGAQGVGSRGSGSSGSTIPWILGFRARLFSHLLLSVLQELDEGLHEVRGHDLRRGVLCMHRFRRLRLGVCNAVVKVGVLSKKRSVVVSLTPPLTSCLIDVARVWVSSDPLRVSKLLRLSLRSNGVALPSYHRQSPSIVEFSHAV